MTKVRTYALSTKLLSHSRRSLVSCVGCLAKQNPNKEPHDTLLLNIVGRRDPKWPSVHNLYLPIISVC